MRIPIALACAAACSLVHEASADGIAFKGRDWSSLQFARENEQLAFITHHDGVQTLLLAVSLQLDDADKAVWVFPVPGTPETTRVDIAADFPKLRGVDPVVEAKRLIDICMMQARGMTVAPWLIEGCLSLGGSLSLSRGVTAYDEVEKDGLHVGVVRADSLADLDAYLREKAAAIPLEHLQTLATYLNERYCLIVSWITSREELLAAAQGERDAERSPLGRMRQPCVRVDFATGRMFFPLRPTSAYGADRVPLRLYATGFVTPKTACAFREPLAARYFRHERFSGDQLNSLVAVDGPVTLDYTLVTGSPQASEFSDDLWLDRYSPADVQRADALARLKPATLVILVAIVAVLSYVSAGLAGLLVFHRWGPAANLGLFNLLTVLCVFLVLKRRPVTAFGRAPDSDNGNVVRERARKMRFLTWFVVLYLFLTIVLQVAGHKALTA